MSDTAAVGCVSVIPTLGVGDVEAALAWYQTALGFRVLWQWGDPPTHAAVTLDDVQIHLSAVEPNPGGSWLYFIVSDVDGMHSRCTQRGVDVVHEPEDQEWGMRELPVRDLVGNGLTFAQASISREPKLPVEREDLRVRLEKRLLSVIRDVADMKGMSVGEMLEETLLHTFEPWKDGVASPHTARDLERIAELKAKHGMDYDVHASYRFQEAAEDPPGS